MKGLLILLTGASLLSAAVPARLHRGIDSTQTFVLTGHTRTLPRSAQDAGPVDASLVMPQLEIHFGMTAAQTADLHQLLALQQDRNSIWYHRWLTPEEFGARFGVNEHDLNQVKAWLEGTGFSNVQIARSQTFLRMSGTAAQVESTFGLSIHQYRQGGKQFYANQSDPVLPRALEGLVSSVKGLSSYHVHSFISHHLRPNISLGINGNHFLGPDDLATIYDLHTLYNSGIDGTGQTIAVVGQSDISLSDIEAFQKAAGLPIKDPRIVLAGVDPGINPDDESEADLDLEWAGAVARGATVIYVNSPDALASAEYAIENNLASVISISFGLCEQGLSSGDAATYNAAFQQANAQGITVVAASGDTGAAACDVDQDPSGTPESVAQFGLAVNFPASSPFVTGLGGTEFDEAQGSFWNSSGNATSYIPEIAWNDTAAWGILSGSGGGASQQFLKPVWQAGAGVPADGQRDVPDIALSASPLHDPYLICNSGSCSNGFAPPVSELYFVGGTSCAAPVFAGMLALLNQSSGAGQGNINAGLYSLASFNSGVFHDVELGDNRVPCAPGTANCTGTFGYSAGPGYDQVTGLGSVDAAQLVEQWGSDFQVTLNPNSVTLPFGSSSNASLQVTRFANFKGPVNFTCAVSSSLTNTTCSVPATIAGSNTGTLTIANSAAANFLKFPHVTPGSLCVLATVFAVFIIWAPRRALVGAVAVLCLVTVGCGGGSANSVSLTSHAISGTVTVTATSGVLQRSIVVPIYIS